MSFSFEKTIVWKGYHIYKNTSWSKVKVSDKAAIELETRKKQFLDIDHYTCAVKIKSKYFEHLIPLDHIPWKIYRHVHSFIKTESERVRGHIESSFYWVSPIPASELEIPL